MMARICKIERCGKKVVGLGLCENHYRRLKRWGDPLGGKTGPGKAIQFFNEQVMNYAGTECLIWPFSKDDHGYAKIQYDGKLRKVTRILCEKVYGPPPSRKHEAAHSCGNGHLGCVAKPHLSWKTPKENQADRIAHGTDGRGSRNPMARLSEAQAAAVKEAAKLAPQKAVAEQFGIAQTTVSAIVRGINWGWMQ